MKRIVSILLAVLLLGTLVVPVAAQGEYVLEYQTAFYSASGISETVPAGAPADVMAKETSGGLVLHASSGYNPGFSINVPDVDSYVIEVTLVMDAFHYQSMYYGWGIKEDPATWNGTFTPYTYPTATFTCVDNVASGATLCLYSGNRGTDAESRAVAQAMVRGTPVTYTFTMQSGVLTTIAASAVIDGETVTNSVSPNISNPTFRGTTFGMNLRGDKNDVLHESTRNAGGVTIRAISVTPDGEQTQTLNFVQEASDPDYTLTWAPNYNGVESMVGAPGTVGVTPTEDGLRIHGDASHDLGFTVNLPDVDTYTVAVDLTMDVFAAQLLYWGWGLEESPNNRYSPYTVAPGDSGNNMAWSGVNGDQLVAWDWRMGINDPNVTNALATALATHAKAGKPLRFVFNVTGGMLTSLVISAETDSGLVATSVTFAQNLSAAGKVFGMNLRGANAAGSGVTIHRVAVSYGGTTQAVSTFAPGYIGAQQYVGEDGSGNIRFVAGVDDWTRYDALGFRVTARNADGETLFAVDRDLRTVYSALTATAEDGSAVQETAAKYEANALMAYAICGIPANVGEVTFTVVPTWTLDGVAYEGAGCTVVYNPAAEEPIVSQTPVA